MGTSEFHLFGPLRSTWLDKRLAANADVQQAVTSWLQTLATDFFCQDTSLDVMAGQMVK
jgi:hypothetical protein